MLRTYTKQYRMLHMKPVAYDIDRDPLAWRVVFKFQSTDLQTWGYHKNIEKPSVVCVDI